MKGFNPLAILAVLLIGMGGLAVPAFAAEVYKWTDENGVIHFSDKKPVDRTAEVQSVPEDAPATEAAPSDASEAGPSAAQQRREDIERKARESQEQEERTQQQCQAWQAEVNRLEPNRRVFYTNEEGETERMDDVERTDRVAELKTLIAENCP
jgi:hypothetical protein